MAYSVFVSHSSEDYELVRRIQDAARPLGIQIYTFEQDLQPGADLPTKLVDQLEAVDAVIAILSRSAASSPAVNQELGVAKAGAKPIVALLEEGVNWSRFTLLQGTEYLALNRENPAETLVQLTGRMAQMKAKSQRETMVLLLALAGLALWANRS